MRGAVVLAVLLAACRSEGNLASRSDGGLTIELRRYNGGIGNPSSVRLMEQGQKKGGWEVDCFTEKARIEVQGKERRVAFRCPPYYAPRWLLLYVDHGHVFRAGTDIGRGDEPDWTKAKPFAEAPGELGDLSRSPERQEGWLQSMEALGDKPLFDAIVAFRKFRECAPCKKYEGKLSPERREDLRKLGL